MADYYPLISRAVSGLDKNTGDARRALYERARAALVAQLRNVTPALDKSDVTRERLSLEEAIRRVEGEAARSSTTRSAKTKGVLKDGVVDGMQYTLYEDGSITAVLPSGAVTFKSISDLRKHIEDNSDPADREEAKRRKDEEEAKRRKDEEEARHRKQEEEAKRHKDEEEARQRRQEDEAKRHKDEEEVKRRKDEEETKQRDRERRPGAVRARLAEVASPAPSLTPDGRLDAGPNELYDAPTEYSDLPALPLQQHALIQTILSDLPRNSPKYLRTSLENYGDELKARGVQPILGLLKDMAAIIEAATGAPDARQEWLEEGMCVALRLFAENHALFVKHFPLDPKREELYARTVVDENNATGSILSKPFEMVAKAAFDANKARITTDDFLKIVDKMAEFAKVISTQPPSLPAATNPTPPSSLGGNVRDTIALPLPIVGPEDRIISEAPPVSPKKRVLLSGLGFFERAYNLLGATATLTSPAEGNILLTALRNAIDVLSKLIGF